LINLNFYGYGKEEIRFRVIRNEFEINTFISIYIIVMDSIDQRLIELIEKYSHLYDKNSYDKIKIQNLCSNILYTATVNQITIK